LNRAPFDSCLVLDETKGKLTIPGISNLVLRSVRSDDLLNIAKAIVGLPRRLVPYIRQAEYVERLREAQTAGRAIDPDFQEFLKETGPEHRVAEVKRQGEGGRGGPTGAAVPGGGGRPRPAAHHAGATAARAA